MAFAAWNKQKGKINESNETNNQVELCETDKTDGFLHQELLNKAISQGSTPYKRQLLI